MKKLLTTALTCLLLTGCVQANVTSQRLPTANTQPFKSLLVFNAGMTLTNSKSVEAGLTEDLASTTTVIHLGLAALPYDATPDDVFAKAEAMNVEGLLVISEESSEYVKHYTPPSYIPPTTNVKVKTKNGQTAVKATTTGGYWTSGSTSESPQGKFVANLYDLRTKGKYDRIWLADIAAAGSELNTMEHLFEEVGPRTIQKLKDDGLVLAPPK